MSLWPVDTVAPCMEYIDLGRCFPSPPPLWYEGRWWYNPRLVTCPRHYTQETDSIAGFFYEPNNDILVLYLVLKTTYWPNWDVRRYEFRAGDGAWLNRDAVLNRESDTFLGTGGLYLRSATMGSYNKIYGPWRLGLGYVGEINWRNSRPVDGGWRFYDWDWDRKAYRFAVVNRVDGVVAAAESWELECLANVDTDPTIFGRLRLPNVLDYLAYENRNYCWGITKDGVILKADYLIPRWEMISTVQDPADNVKGFAITFDTRRKRVVVFRWRTPAADGACRNQLEFYYPMVNAARLLPPVPVTSLRTGRRITLVSHLVGDAGEGLTPYIVNGELVEPVSGRLVTPFTNTEQSGRAAFQYQAPYEPCTETLRVSTIVEETL
jgi:hypothetical protein